MAYVPCLDLAASCPCSRLTHWMIGCGRLCCSADQDQAYWPQGVPDSRTVTVSLALNDAHTHNGCLRVVPGSQREPNLRHHRPAGGGLERKADEQRVEATKCPCLQRGGAQHCL